MSREEIRERYRFQPESINILVDILFARLDRPTRRSSPIPLVLSVLVTLQFFATGTHYILISDHGLSKISICRAVRATLSEIAILLGRFIKLQTGGDLQVTQREFYNIAKIMGQQSGVGGLTFHAYCKHRFTSTITSATKMKMWDAISERFTMRASVPRDQSALTKKWDNLCQVHRAAYQDFKNSLSATGGGEAPKASSVLTEAVMTVIGKNSQNVRGIVEADAMDSSLLLVENMNASKNKADDVDNTNFSLDDSFIEDINELPEVMFDTSEVQVVCCKCGCHKSIDELKHTKLPLQIQVLRKQLGLPINIDKWANSSGHE